MFASTNIDEGLFSFFEMSFMSSTVQDGGRVEQKYDLDRSSVTEMQRARILESPG
jgi:hypothetical protein